MGSFSLAHWLIVIVVLLLIFGPKRLSEVGKGLGQGIRNFKKGMEGEEGGARDGEEEEDVEERPKRLKGERERPPKRLKPARDEDDRDEDEDEDEEEEEVVRPRKKSRRA